MVSGAVDGLSFRTGGGVLAVVNDGICRLAVTDLSGTDTGDIPAAAADASALKSKEATVRSTETCITRK